ncbi:MAG: hypothetical protein GXO33_03700, partial [Epsilonproteobacteria bacterium]|nr:hypothetical protein [Campylobacterota bacterium]
MGRAVVGLLLCLQWVFAYQYDTLLLQAQAKIYPKLLMLKANLPVATRPVRLVVVARQEERQRAEEVVQMIARLYHGKIGGFPFETEVTTYKELERFPKAYDALYLLKGEARQIAAAVEIARWINVPTFVYDYKDLEKGA